MITTNHDDIKRWIQNYNGKPEIIDDPTAKGDTIGLRINFPGNTDEKYFVVGTQVRRGIGWDEFFEIFEKQNLAFEYFEKQEDTHPSATYRFVKRDTNAYE